MVAAKNSKKRFAAASSASATIAGTTIDATIVRDIRGGLAAGTTVSWRLESGLGSYTDPASIALARKGFLSRTSRGHEATALSERRIRL